MHAISERVLMLFVFTKNYENLSILVVTTGCQSWRAFDTQCSFTFCHFILLSYRQCLVFRDVFPCFICFN